MRVFKFENRSFTSSVLTGVMIAVIISSADAQESAALQEKYTLSPVR
jgi:hypothetical protein